MAYFGGIFFANMGGGGGQNYVQIRPNSTKSLEMSGNSGGESIGVCKGSLKPLYL